MPTAELAVLLGRLATSHCPPIPKIPPRRGFPPYTTSLTVKNDRFGNKSYTVYSSGSPVHYIATLEESSNTDRT